MSVHVVSWVLEHSPAQLANRLVLISLADHAHKDGTGACPSTDTVAHEARVSRRSAQYAIDALEQAGAITRQGWSEYGTVTWKVEMTEAAATAVFGPRPRSKPKAGGANVAPPGRAAGGATCDTEGVQHATDGVLHVAPEPSLLTNDRTEPPLAGARARGTAPGGELVPGLPAEGLMHVPLQGITPRVRQRLLRTARRLGLQVVHDDPHQKTGAA